MKKHFVKRGLSFIIVMIMVIGLIPMTAMTASAAQTTPIAYANAKDGDLLYTVNFTSSNFKTDTANTNFVKTVTAANVPESNALKVAYGDTAASATDHRYGGWLPAYTLENSTYTIEMDFVRTAAKAKIYFGYGKFNFGPSTTDQLLGIEVGTYPIRWMEGSTARQNVAPANADEKTKSSKYPVLFGNMYTANNTTHFKIVLSGSAVSSNAVTVNANIYSKDANNIYVKHSSAQFTMPADKDYIYLGVGEYNALASNTYYSISNVNIFKGDTYRSNNVNLKTLYDNASYGQTLYTIDPSGISDTSKNGVNGYQWFQMNTGASSDSNGVITVNSDTAGMQGFYTPMPFADTWNCGNYTLEMTLNADVRSAIHVMDITGVNRIGFGFGGNTTRADGIDDWNWFGPDFAQTGNLFNLSGTTSQGYIPCNAAGIAFNVYNANVLRKNTTTEANVRIEFDTEAKVTTLYELTTDDKWVRVSSIDYSGVSTSLDITPIFSLHAYNANTNLKLSNAKFVKGELASSPEFDFEAKYDQTAYGDTLYSIDFSGISDSTMNGVNNYEWVQRDQGAASANGVLTVNTAKPEGSTATGDEQGIYSPIAIGDAWNYGNYTMLATVNGAARCAIHIFDTEVQQRIGFIVGGNMTRPDGLSDMSYNGQDFSYSTAMKYLADMTTAMTSKTNLTFETFNPDTVRKDTSATGDVNVKIEVNNCDKVFTLYELNTEGNWIKVSAIDYSAVTQKITPVFSTHVWDWSANITIKNVSYVKGLSETKTITYVSGGYTGVDSTSFSADNLAAFAEKYAEKYALDKDKIGGWTADGSTSANVEELYNNAAEGENTGYAPLEITLLPLMTYETLTDAIAVRAVQSKIVAGKYNVKVISAVNNITDYTAFGYEITKVSLMPGDDSAGFETVNDLVTKKVYSSVKVGDIDLAASAVGGQYIVAISINDESVVSDSQVDYVIKPFAYNKQGEKVYGTAKTLSFVDGVYTPTATALEIPVVQ